MSKHPAMSYAAAAKWEGIARDRGVSQVARSPRGFMRAYQKAGSFAKLPEAWRHRREAFIARHVAQVRQRGEQLWKTGKDGRPWPSRRALALIMWAYMPPGGARRNPGKTKHLATYIAEKAVRGFLVVRMGLNVSAYGRDEQGEYISAGHRYRSFAAAEKAYRNLISAWRVRKWIQAHNRRDDEDYEPTKATNPGQVLRMPPDFFRNWGKSREGLKQARQYLYEQSEVWWDDLDALAEWLQRIRVRVEAHQRQAGFKVVGGRKMNPPAKGKRWYHNTSIAADPRHIKVHKMKKRNNPKKAPQMPRGKSRLPIKAALRHFGTTTDIREAGYVLPSGTYLDFSGREGAGYKRVGSGGNTRYVSPDGRDDFRGQRYTDHRQIAVAWEGLTNESMSGNDAMVFFQDLGVMRIDAHAGLIDLRTKPSLAQESVIKHLVSMHDGDVAVDVTDGQRTWGHYYDGAKPVKVLGDVRRFFRGEDLPMQRNPRPTTSRRRHNPPRKTYRNAADAAADFSKTYGSQAAGWAKDMSFACRAQADRRFWGVVMLLLQDDAMPRTNPPRRGFAAALQRLNRQIADIRAKAQADGHPLTANQATDLYLRHAR